MKKTILTFGLISGAISSLVMVAIVPFADRIGFERGPVIGYTSIVLSFLLVFFGIRSYRDNMGNGQITFLKAFAVGISITLISCACYVVTWEVIYYNFLPDFWDKYGAHLVEKLRASGASDAAVQARLHDVENDQVEFVGARKFEGFYAVGCADDGVAFFFQTLAKKFDHALFVFGQQQIHTRDRLIRKYTAGVTPSDRTIETRIPPITAMASGCSICEPAPNAKARGSMPAMVAMAVITIGLNLLRPAWIMASSGEYPQAMELLANGKIKVKPLITAVAPLGDGPQWFSRLHAGEPNLMKVVLDPRA